MKVGQRSEIRLKKLTTELKNVDANIKTHQVLLMGAKKTSEIYAYKIRLRQLWAKRLHLEFEVEKLSQLKLPFGDE